MEHIYEIRLWHGENQKPERWHTKEEPEYLASGAIRFRCVDDMEHYVNGTIDITKRPERRSAKR